MPSAHNAPLAAIPKLGLALRIWAVYLGVCIARRRRPLPALVERLGRPPHRVGGRSHHPERLGSAVHRALRLGRRRPRCLAQSLVLYRLLSAQGARAELVIGLPASPTDHEAHAWVEIDDRDVGPPPGRLGHVALARYP